MEMMIKEISAKLLQKQNDNYFVERDLAYSPLQSSFFCF